MKQDWIRQECDDPWSRHWATPDEEIRDSQLEALTAENADVRGKLGVVEALLLETSWSYST